jgi:hypothetical protein
VEPLHDAQRALGALADGELALARRDRRAPLAHVAHHLDRLQRERVGAGRVGLEALELREERAAVVVAVAGDAILGAAGV